MNRVSICLNAIILIVTCALVFSWTSSAEQGTIKLFQRSYGESAQGQHLPNIPDITYPYEENRVMEECPEILGIFSCRYTIFLGAIVNKLVYHGRDSSIYWTVNLFDILVTEAFKEKFQSERLEQILNRIHQGG